MKVIVGSKSYTLSDKDYKAQGGQGTIYLKNNLIFKIYHDVSQLIPERKIEELQELKKITNIIIPTESIFDEISHQRIGFVMNYVNDTEYLCKLFVSSFKTDNNLTNQNIIDLVESMQKTLEEIHNHNVIVGDYNEMNFLVDKGFKIPYHIDTDSYQTKSFKCNAIMESVRDPLLPFGTFNEMSDWFSWAIVSFQLYTGIHPFKGKHPAYKGNELTKRMNDGISVFDKDVSLPKIVNFNSIPKNHLDWYKNVFVKNERTIPPLPNGIVSQQIIKTVIDNTGNIITDLVYEYSSNILDIVYKNSSFYVLTKEGFYHNDKKIFNGTFKNGKIIFTVMGDILIVYRDDKNVFIRNETEVLFTKEVNDNVKYKVFNNMLYEINENGVIQYSFEKIGKLKMLPNFVSTIHFNTCEIFEGCFIDGLYGKYNACIPVGYNKCFKVKLPELNSYKILEAKRIENWLFVIAEKKGILSLFYFKFEKDFQSYSCRIEDDVDFRTLNVIVKPNGVVILNKEDDTLELFADFNKNKLIGNTPIRNNFKLFDANNTCFIDTQKLYSIKMK